MVSASPITKRNAQVPRRPSAPLAVSKNRGAAAVMMSLFVLASLYGAVKMISFSCPCPATALASWYQLSAWGRLEMLKPLI